MEYRIELKTPESHYEIDYGMRTKLNVSYFNLQLESEGNLELKTKEARLRTNVSFGHDSDGKLMIKDVNFTTETNKKFSYGEAKALNKLPGMVFAIDDKVRKHLLEKLVPKMNRALKKFKSVDELTDVVIRMTASLRRKATCNDS